MYSEMSQDSRRALRVRTLGDEDRRVLSAYCGGEQMLIMAGPSARPRRKGVVLAGKRVPINQHRTVCESNEKEFDSVVSVLTNYAIVFGVQLRVVPQPTKPASHILDYGQPTIERIALPSSSDIAIRHRDDGSIDNAIRHAACLPHREVRCGRLRPDS